MRSGNSPHGDTFMARLLGARREERGFSMVELMIVLLIIAILVGIAIPVFLGIRTRAQDRAAQTAVANVLRVEKGFYVGDNASYSGDGDDLEAMEPTMNYDTATNSTCVAFSADPQCVKVTLLGQKEVLLVVQANSGTYWAIREVGAGTGAGTYYNEGGDSSPPDPADVTDDGW